MLPTNLKINSQKIYTCFVKKIEKDMKINLTETLLINPKSVFQYIESLKQSKKTTQNKHYLVRTHIKNNNLNVKYNDFSNELLKKTYVELPTRNELKELLLLNKTEIVNKQDQLLLSLFLNYEVVLRSDLCMVKLNNFTKTEPHYKDGIIYFPKILKTSYKNIKITLSDTDKEIIEKLKLEGDYIMLNRGSDVNNYFCKHIKKISSRYLKYDLTVNDYRRLIEREMITFLEIDDLFIEKFKKMRKLASLRGHDLNTVFNHYI